MFHNISIWLVGGIIALCVGVASLSHAQTRLGIHFTQEELTIWQQRAVSGPYKTTGDVSTNSPGDWAKITADAATFLANPTADHWTGQTTNTCVMPNQSMLPSQQVDLGSRLLRAAFYALVTGNTSHRNAVKTELLSQAAEPGTNFSNTSRWCIGGATNDANPFFEIANWQTRLLFGYDYIRGGLSATDRTTLDTWFRNMGIYWQTDIDSDLSSDYVDRSAENYALNANGLAKSGNPILAYYGGPSVRDLHTMYNNRRGGQVLVMGMAGILTDHTTLKNRTKRWVKEWLRYAVLPDGTPTEFYRWLPTVPTLGWAYGGGPVTCMLAIADAFARLGDTELFTHSTSEGFMDTVGGPKTLRTALTTFLRYSDHTILRYGTNNATNATNANYLIDSEDEVSNEHRNGDVWTTIGNMYFKDAYIKSIYMRTAPNTAPYPANPPGNFYSWGGPSGMWPAMLFMFGNMETQVNPYPGSGGTVPIAPANLRLDPAT
jgi:hypothetical protein